MNPPAAPSPAASSRPSVVDLALTWLQGRERPILAGTIALQILVLVSMIAFKTNVLTSGDTVMLRVQPVDPRDFFRGDYVVLSYAFSRVSPDQVSGLLAPPQGPEGMTIYAVLEPEADGEHWQATRFTADPPQGVAFLRGRYVGWNRVEYGIESFFVQEGRGRDYEQAVRERRLSARVVVDRKGRAVLTGLVEESAGPPR